MPRCPKCKHECMSIACQSNITAFGQNFFLGTFSTNLATTMNYLQLVAIRRRRSICLFIDFIDIEIIIIAYAQTNAEQSHSPEWRIQEISAFYFQENCITLRTYCVNSSAWNKSFRIKCCESVWRGLIVASAGARCPDHSWLDQRCVLTFTRCDTRVDAFTSSLYSANIE